MADADALHALFSALTDTEIREVIRRTWQEDARVEIHRAALDTLAERHGREVAEIIYWQATHSERGW